MLRREGPVAVLGEFLDNRLVDVLLVSVKLCSEDGEATDAQALQYLGENSNVEAAVIDHGRADNKFECFLELRRDLDILVADNLPLQLFVGLLLFRDGE